MSVRVRYFAVLRERRGRDDEPIDLLPGETVAALYARLFPVGLAGRLPVLFAANHAYVKADHILADGDEVAFIPPLGGG